MNNLYISVHIPKTAGTSFANILKQIAGKFYFEDYADMPLASQYTKRKINNLNKDNQRYKKIVQVLNTHLAIVHGHFLASKYDCVFPQAKSLIWLRNPVERLVSHYYYWQRHPDMKNDICKQMIIDKMTLDDFISFAPMYNIYQRFLVGKALESFYFIGITEEFNKSIQLLEKLFNTTIVIPQDKARQNPEKTKEGYTIPPATIKLIQTHHAQDIVLYQQAQKIFNQLYQEYIGD